MVCPCAGRNELAWGHWTNRTCRRFSRLVSKRTRAVDVAERGASRARELARNTRLADEPQQLCRVDGLGQVMVEAGGQRLAAVGVLAPAGDGHQRRAVA